MEGGRDEAKELEAKTRRGCVREAEEMKNRRKGKGKDQRRRREGGSKRKTKVAKKRYSFDK